MNKDNLNNIKNSGFKIPENYFQDIEYTILNNAKLKSLVKDSGFKVPDNYFEKFTPSVQNKTKVITLFNRKNIILVSSIAAAIVLFFSLNIFNTATISINDLDTETVDSYILDETNISDIVALFDDNELNETQFIDYNINDETIDSYLESVEVNELFLE